MLILKHLYVENFMSIEQLDINFDSNTMIAITGANGEGKSALIYAISFLLTGYRNGKSYGGYVKIGADAAKLSLTAILNDEELFCEAEIPNDRLKKVSAVKRRTLYKGVEYINSSHDQFIKENELDYAEPLIFFFQDTNKDIIKAKPAERATILKKLFRFEFPEIVEELKARQEISKANQITINATLNEIKSQTFEPLALAREPLPEYISSLEAKEKDLIEKITQAGNLDENALDIVRKDLSTVEVKINTTQEELKRNTLKLENLSRDIKDEESILSSISLEDYQKEVEERKKELLLHKEEYQKAKEIVNNLTSKISLAHYQSTELEKQLSISKTGICHACGQAIDETHIFKLEEQKDNLNKELDKLREALSLLHFDDRDIKGEELSKKISQLEDKIFSYNELKKQKEANLLKYQELQNLINNGGQKEYLSILLTQKEDLQKKVVELENLQNLIIQKRTLKEELKNIQETLATSKEIIFRNAERRKFNESLAIKNQEKLNRIDSLNQQSNEILKDITDTKTMLDIFETKFPSYLILQATQLLENCLNEVVKKAFPYMNIKLEMQRSGVDFLYTPNEDSSEWLPIAQASGAQKAILSLAYKTSLARLHGISCILLDEVDESCSIENSKLVYRFIGSLDNFSQVIFISQRPESVEAARETNPDIIVYEVSKGNYSLLEG